MPRNTNASILGPAVKRGREKRGDHVGAVVNAIYAAALEENRWREIATDIAHALGCSSSVLGYAPSLREALRPISATTIFDAKDMDAYVDYYWRQDVLLEHVTRAHVNTPFLNNLAIRDDVFEKTEFYRDWFRKLDLFYVMGANISLGEEQPIYILSVQRPRLGGPFGDADARLFTQLAGHLRTSLQIRNRLLSDDHAREAGRLNLEHMNSATIVVGPGGRLSYATRKAEKLLREGDAIRVTRGYVSLTEGRAHDRFAFLINWAIETASGREYSPTRALLASRAGRPSLSMLVAPYELRDVPGAILVIRDPEDLSNVGAVLEDLYGLTPTEAVVTTELVNGNSLESISYKNHVSLNTVRTQLKSIFTKTGTSRQGQLVSLVMRSVASLGFTGGGRFSGDSDSG